MTLDPATLRAGAARAALCLDFDGTLAPIVDDPETSAPLPGMPELLARLARRFRVVALVSGRPAAFLAEHVQAPGVHYLGLYGMEAVQDGQVRTDPEAERYRPAIQAAARDLAGHPDVAASGAHLEDKGLALGVHLRRVAEPARWAGPVEAAAREVASRRGLVIAPGKLVYELRPPVELDKGDALERVVRESQVRLAAMAGDDLGDLAAFRALDRLEAQGGLEGLRIVVRSEESPAALLDVADLIVDGPEGLQVLLEDLAEEPPAGR